MSKTSTPKSAAEAAASALLIQQHAALQVAIERMAAARRHVVLGDLSPEQVIAKATWADAHVAVLMAYHQMRASYLVTGLDCLPLPALLKRAGYPPSSAARVAFDDQRQTA